MGNGENGRYGRIAINVAVEKVNEDSELVTIHLQDPMERNAEERQWRKENAILMLVKVI